MQNTKQREKIPFGPIAFFLLLFAIDVMLFAATPYLPKWTTVLIGSIAASITFVVWLGLVPFDPGAPWHLKTWMTIVFVASIHGLTVAAFNLTVPEKHWRAVAVFIVVSIVYWTVGILVEQRRERACIAEKSPSS